MAPRFVTKTVVSEDAILGTGTVGAVRSYDRLQAALQARFGPSAGTLFSEPVANWDGTGEAVSVSWYSDATGTASPLASLPPERRTVLQNRLRQDLARITPALDDPEFGPLLQAALCLRSADALYAVGDQIILTDWGLLPADAGQDRDPAALLRASAIASFLPDPARSVPPGPVATAPPPMRPAPAVLPPGMAPGPSPVPAPRAASAAWFAVPAALVVAALFLALGYWRGASLAADRAASRPNTVSVLDEAAARRALQQQEELNTALEKQIEDRRKLLDTNVCVADPATLPRLGPDRTAAPPPAVVPPPPGGQVFQGNLADLLKQGIVMVLVPDGNDDLSVGTGFFIAPDIIVTNRHVVEGAVQGAAQVVNVKLGRPLAAQVTASTPNSDIGSLDVAILRVAPQPGIQPLSLTTVAAELDSVIAAGYPALITRSDAGMERLLRDGDLTAAPQLVMTDGRIQAIQTSPGGAVVMPHGAAISGGSSGGPLVDACGRVVGINTFIRSDTESAAHANYALKTDSIVPFLKAQGTSFALVDGPCNPAAPAAAAAAPTPAAVALTPANPTQAASPR